MTRCRFSRIGILDLAIPLTAVIVLAGSSCAGEDWQGLETVMVEDAAPRDRSSGSRVSQSPQPVMPPSADPIQQELSLQRAIADSLKGQPKQAIASLSSSKTEDTASKYAAAMLLMQAGDVAEGVILLERIAGLVDAPPEAAKYLAVGYLHLDRPKACEQAANEYLAAYPADTYAHYVRGLAILRQNQPQRAAGALRQAGYDDREVSQISQVVMQIPVDVQQQLSTINNTMGAAPWTERWREPAADRPYNFTLLMAGEYDSNVPLQPHFSGLGSNFIDYEDFRFVLASFLDAQLLYGESFNIGLVGSTFHTFQSDSDDFDIQNYMGGVYANALLRDDLIGSFRYEFHHTLISKSQFASEHRVTPSLTWLGTRGHTTVYYEFDPINARAPALIPAQLQSADIHRIGLTQAIYTSGGDGRVYLGYQLANANAEGADFDRTTNMVTARVEQPLQRRWIADGEVRYFWDDYDNPNSLDFFDRARDDNRLVLRAGLQKNFCSPVSLRFDYTFTDNDSNTENLFGVRFYDYSRHIFSTQLIFSL